MVVDIELKREQVVETDVLTIFSARAAFSALWAAAAVSMSTTLRDRCLFVLRPAVGVEAIFLFVVVCDVVLDEDFETTFAVVTGTGEGFAYTVRVRVFLAVERVTTGMMKLDV